MLGGERLQLGVVGGRGDHRSGVEQARDDGHGQRRALGGIGPGADLVEQHERRRPGGLDEAHDVAQVAAEGGERLRDALLVADVGHDPAEDRQARPIGRRHAQPCLVHEREQAERLEADRLAAGVRPGDDEGAVAEAVAEAQVDRHGAVAQQRMARGEQLGGVACDWAGRTASIATPSRARAIHRSARASASRLARSDSLRASTARRQLVEDALLLALLRPATPRSRRC